MESMAIDKQDMTEKAIFMTSTLTELSNEIESSQKLYFGPCQPLREFKHHHAKGFSLIELLIIISIISIVSALVMVTFNLVRFQSRNTVCASQLRQWGVSLISFAQDNRGFYPAQPIPTAIGRNAQDISGEMFDSLCGDYGMPSRIYACPHRISGNRMDDFTAWSMGWRNATGMVLLGYGYWVQRAAANQLFPPSAVAAPSRTASPNPEDIPLMGDLIICSIGWTAPGCDHSRNGRYRCNQLFTDGQVRSVDDSLIQWRYDGTYANWR